MAKNAEERGRGRSRVWDQRDVYLGYAMDGGSIVGRGMMGRVSMEELGGYRVPKMRR